MRKIAILLLSVLALTACHKEEFRVAGHLEEAEGETLYLEHLGLVRTETIDSVVLPASGKFRFAAARPEYPDLYRLRIENRTLVLAIDSLDQIEVEGSGRTLSDATISGSDKSVQIQSLRRSLREQSMEEHRAYAKSLILADPGSMVAYYALFQQKGGLPVWDIYDKTDRALFSAVATSMNVWMPQYQRTKVLYAQVIDVINGERRAQNAATMQAFIEESENTFLDATLRDENGQEQSISQYKGKVIVLDFASIQMERYKGYIFEMREVYNAYHSRGVEIYEIYPDPNRLVWEDQVRALPWTTVCTEQGLYDPVFTTFNVHAIPTLFVYDQQGTIVGRFGDFESLKRTLDTLVK